MAAPPDPALFAHVRVVLGMVVSLGIARLLSGVAVFVQHPGRQKPDAIHLLWVFSTLLLLLHFWWWEFDLAHLPTWRFEFFFLVLYYAVINFLLCALLFPNDLNEYAGYRDYLLSRRRWFFGLLAMGYAVDVIDTMLKGSEHLAQLGPEYPLRIGVYLLLCLVAAITRNERFHLGFAAANLAYQISFIIRRYDLIG
ncbi:MAG: hypothetical protein RLZZ618_2270 [Pseudomonadota bacterium]|jgi:hypothetical protein